MRDISEKLEGIAEKLLNSALLFNNIVDEKKLEEMDIDAIVNKIKSQYLIALEEVKETETALDDNDVIEVYDGYCDVFVTVPILFLMWYLFLGKFNKQYDDFYDEYDSLMDELSERYGKLLDYSNQLDLDILEEYANRVIENNMEKFTTEQDEFEMWKATDVSHIPTSSVVDGVRYYFFIDENNKVKKRLGFPKVAVEDLFDGKK